MKKKRSYKFYMKTYKLFLYFALTVVLALGDITAPHWQFWVVLLTVACIDFL